jgi:hypothetical protein
MSPNLAYSTDVLLALISIFVVVYIIYGRAKHRSLVGNYKPGVPGYDVFLKIIANKYLVISSILAVFFTINAFVDARRVLQSLYSDSVLIVAPVGVTLLFLLAIFISSKLFSQK